MENILDLLMDYTKNGKTIDEEYISKVISILVKIEQLQYFVNNVDFCYYNIPSVVENAVMTYNFFSKTIRISLKEINDIYTKNYNNNAVDYEYLHLLFCNLRITKYILHEIEHAIQMREIFLGKSNLKNKLLSICFAYFIDVETQSQLSRFFNKQQNLKRSIIRCKLYRDNYEFLPAERLANYNSALNILEILKPISNEIPDYMVNYFQQYINHILISGYDLSYDIFSPTERYLKQFELSGYPNIKKYLDDEFYCLLNKAQYKDLKTKLELGVNISKKDYQKIKSGYISF